MTESLINKLKELLGNHDIKADDQLLSSSLRELNFTQTLNLVHMMDANDIQGVSELLNIDYDSDIEEAYGTVGTRQPSASTIQAQKTSDDNNQRDFTNNQQDQQRDATVVQRTVAGGNKQPTGTGARRYDKRADPDDVQRGQNAQATADNAALANQNAAEIERLKQLAYGRR